MHLENITAYLETIAPIGYQESYDNSGLIVGDPNQHITGILVSLDCIEASVQEAIDKKCNLVVAHHPIVFSGLKKFNKANYVQRTLQLAIKHDIAIYAIHTNLDNVYHNGVNAQIADRLGLENTRILKPQRDSLIKLVTYAPLEHKQEILEVLFSAGAGQIGNYSECSFSTEGIGTYLPGDLSNPAMGKKGERSMNLEIKLEVIVPKILSNRVLKALQEAHPYEEVAYELYPVLNNNQDVGAGIIGNLSEPISSVDFLTHLKRCMNLKVIKYTPFSKNIQRVAICGGAGQFLIDDAKYSKSDVYITSDIKYHSFFDAEDSLMICDIGHYESEKYTIDLLYDILRKKFSTFAILKTEIDTNPVKYFL